MPLPFIKPQDLFEQGEIGIVEMFSCLAAMLPDFLFLQGTSHPAGSILPFELVQLKEVFRQHGFPLFKSMHIFFLLINEERALPCGHTLHSTSVETSHKTRRSTTRENADEGRQTSANWSDDRRYVHREKVSPKLLFPAYTDKGRRRVLRQARGDHMPDAAKPFASGLTWCAISREVIEGVPIVLHLHAIGICLNT